MRYEEYENVGEVSTTKEYEGTPEEIAQLIYLIKNPKNSFFSEDVQKEKKDD